MTESDLLISYLTTTLNVQKDELSELLYDKDAEGNTVLKEAALTELKTRDASRIRTIKDGLKKEKTEIADIAYNKAKAEVMTHFETEVKEKYGIETEKQGIEFIEELIGQHKTSKLKDTEVKTHPVFIEAEKKWKDEKRRVEADYKKQVDDLNSKFTREKTMRTVYSHVENIFNALNPEIPEDPILAKERKEDFFSKVDGYNYELQEDGNHIVIDREGKRLEDEHSNPVSFSKFVQQIAARNYNFKKDNKPGMGNRTQTGGGGVPVVPKSIEEYNKAYANATTPEDKMKLADAWLKSQGIEKK